MRGAMNGTFHLFGSLGLLFFTLFAGQLFDKVGPASPFALVGICDYVLFIAALILACLGKLNN